MKLATAAQMRELDRRAIEERRIPSIDLMERAAAEVAQAALDLLPDKPAKCRAAVFSPPPQGGDGPAQRVRRGAGGLRPGGQIPGRLGPELPRHH